MSHRRFSTLGEVLTVEEAAAYLRLSKSTLYQRKDIPRHRIPGFRGWRFFKAELTDLLKGNSGTIDSTAQGSPAPHGKYANTVYHRNPRYRK